MTEYAIFCSRNGFGELDIDRPVGAISHDGKRIVIVGTDELVERWKPYFENPSSGWANHSGTKKPLTSLFGTMTYDIAIVVDDSGKGLYDDAVAALQDPRMVVVAQGEPGG